MSPIELTPFDTADYLTTDRECLLLLNVALEEGDMFDVGLALGAIARAKKLTEVAETAGLDRFYLYKEGEIPTSPIGYDTAAQVVSALGFQLQVIRHQTPAPAR